ncbi:MAG: hypothetical protein EOM50_22860 [Erysipelotrichia bacterium]|nr:hypothetical protein [Erysipelotrichia bacterium]
MNNTKRKIAELIGVLPQILLWIAIYIFSIYKLWELFFNTPTLRNLFFAILMTLVVGLFFVIVYIISTIKK